MKKARPARKEIEYKEDILRGIEPLYFIDYCTFSGLVRQYLSYRLREGFTPQSHPVVRRFHLVSILSQEYAAYEDVAAVLKAFLDYRASRVPFPLLTLMEYRPGEAQLDKVFTENDITSGINLYEKLHLKDWLPSHWGEWFPHLDLEKTLRLSCHFLVTECRDNQKKFGISAYNKIKHGLLVVPSAKTYISTMLDVPAALVPNPANRAEAADKPFVVYAFEMDDEKVRAREQSIYFVQTILRLLAALYLTATYPDHIATRWGGGARAMFEDNNFHDIRHFIGEVTAKK